MYMTDPSFHLGIIPTSFGGPNQGSDRSLERPHGIRPFGTGRLYVTPSSLFPPWGGDTDNLPFTFSELGLNLPPSFN